MATYKEVVKTFRWTCDRCKCSITKDKDVWPEDWGRIIIHFKQRYSYINTSEVHDEEILMDLCPECLKEAKAFTGDRRPCRRVKGAL